VAERYFTPEEANEALAEVRPLAERLVDHRRALGEAQARRAEAMMQIAGNGGGLRTSELARLGADVDREAAAVRRCIEEIRAIGAQVKDLERGLVDFPALRAGVEVCLCWQVGEEAIGYWHHPEDGYAGRKPLPL
jgi:hypothetical protein